MRSACFAHLAIRSSSHRLRPNNFQRVSFFHTSSLLHNDGALCNGSITKQQKLKAGFNQGDFLSGSAPVAKEQHAFQAEDGSTIKGNDGTVHETGKENIFVAKDHTSVEPEGQPEFASYSSAVHTEPVQRCHVGIPVQEWSQRAGMSKRAKVGLISPHKKTLAGTFHQGVQVVGEANEEVSSDPKLMSLIRGIAPENIKKGRLMFSSNHLRLSGMAGPLLPELQFDASYVQAPRKLKTGKISNLDFNWLRNYSALFAKKLENTDDLEPVIRRLRRRQFAFLVRRFRQSDLETPVDRLRYAIKSAKKRFPRDLKRGWPEFMILILRYTPEMAAPFLQATYPITKPAMYMVADTIHFIARFCLPAAQTQDDSTSRGPAFGQFTSSNIVELILDIIPQCQHETRSIYGETIDLLLKHIDLQGGYALFTGLRAFDSRISLWGYNSFAQFFASRGEYETALEALELYLDNDGSSENPQFKKTAMKVLRWSIVHPQGYHDSGYIISRFMEMGLRIGQSFQNTLIANAFDSKDAPTALRVFSLMREQGIEPDADTYSRLLKGLRHWQDEVLIDDILGLSWAKVEETRDAYLADELLFWHYVQYVRKAEDAWEKEKKVRIYHEGLQKLVSLYSTVFDKAPLSILGFTHLVPPEQWSLSQSLNMRPGQFTMTIMILAYTRAMVLITEDQDVHPRGIGSNYQMYQRWWHVATQWTLFPNVDEWIKRLFIDMMKRTHTFGIFMHALGAQPATLHRAVTILQGMDKGTVDVAMHSAEIDYNEPIAKPNLISWTILLNAFARHGQPEAAEKCMGTMQSRLVQLDEAAWNSLVKAYAVKQDAKGVVHSLKRKEDAGFGMDQRLVRTLTRLKDHDTLKALLKREIISRDTEISDAMLLGRSDGQDKRSKHMTPKWRPDVEQAVGYEPGVGKRPVNYFDANRTLGLHRESFTATENADEGSQPAGVREDGGVKVFDGRGSFTLKSNDEEDWFEEDEDDRDDFGVSPMDEASRRR